MKRRWIGATVLGLILLITGFVFGVSYADEGNPTIGGLGAYNLPWFNASVGVNAPDYYLDGTLNLTAWIEAEIAAVEGGAGHTHNQDLNTTDDVAFSSVAANILLQDDLSLNATFSGDYITGTAGEKLWFGETVYLDSDGEYYKTDADSATTMYCVAICAESSIAADGSGYFLLEGYIRNDGWSGWTVGTESPLYVSTTLGALTQTVPSGSGDQVQIIGYPVASKIIRFDPDSTVIEIS